MKCEKLVEKLAKHTAVAYRILKRQAIDFL
jgi:hypothetical protein